MSDPSCARPPCRHRRRRLRRPHGRQGAARKPVRVTLVDRQNHHLFQMLLYQVATAGLSPGDIASPIRWILRRQANARVLLADVQRVDVGRQDADLRRRADRASTT